MKLTTVLSRAGSVFKYLRDRRKRRLYKQWVEMAELAPEDIPVEEVDSRIVEEVEEKDETMLPLNRLYIMQGVSLVLLCVILIILIIQSC